MTKLKFAKPIKKIKVKKRIARVRKTPLSRLHTKAKTAFNHWIRERDCRDSVGGDWGNCYTCDKNLLFGDMEAGHYIPGTQISPVRFLPMNVHGQCTRCNKFLHGNYGVYAVRLLRDYGQQELEYLETFRSAHKKWTREELEDIIKTYTNE